MGHLKHFKVFFFTYNSHFKVVFVAALTTPYRKIPQIIAAFLRLNNNNNKSGDRISIYLALVHPVCGLNNITSSVH